MDIKESEKSFSSLTFKIVYKTYIINNSQKEYIEDFCKYYPNVEYCSRPNIGYGPAHNMSIRKSLIPEQLVQNSDVIF